jgi:MFS family permease
VAEDWLLTVYAGKNRYLTAKWVKFNRWQLFFASFIVQFCIGSLYSWSVLNKPIDTYLFDDPKAEKAVNSFYIAVGMFGTTTAIMGPWIERHGPRAGIVLGATSFLIGNIIVGIGLYADLMGIVYVGYGVFCGFGMGLCYISPVSALQKWFPDYRGMAAGFAVGGYGAGSVVWSKVYLPAIRAVGLPSMFFLLGGVISFTLFVCAIVLRNPHPEFVIGGLNIHGEAVEEAEEVLHRGEKLSVMSNHEYESITTPSTKDIQDVVEPSDNAHAQVKKLTLIQAIVSPDFLCMYLMFFSNQLYGLIVLSKLSSMCTDIFGTSADRAADIVSINGVFNCCGRLFFPAMTDVLHRWLKIEHAFARKCFYFYALASQIIIIAIFPTLFRHDEYTTFCVLAFILTGSYGGGFGTIPAFLTDMFGAFNIGAMHGLILTSWSLGGVVGGISFNSAYRSQVKDGVSIPEAYISNIHKIFILVCVGAAFIFLVRTNPKDRFEPGYHLSIFGRRIVSIKSKKPAKDEPLLDV